MSASWKIQINRGGLGRSQWEGDVWAQVSRRWRQLAMRELGKKHSRWGNSSSKSLDVSPPCCAHRDQEGQCSWRGGDGDQEEQAAWHLGFPGAASGKESACQCKRRKRCRFSFWVGKISCNRKGQPTPVFLSREFHGQRSLAGYSPWGCRVRHNWVTNTHIHSHTHTHSNTHMSSKLKNWILNLYLSDSKTQVFFTTVWYLKNTANLTLLYLWFQYRL